MTDDNAVRQNLLAIIESEELIAGRYRDIQRIDENGGNGQFSLVFRALDQESGKNFALKFYDPTKTYNVDRVRRFQREAGILKILKSEQYVINCVDGLGTLERRVIDSGSGIEIPSILSLQFIPMELADSDVENFIYQMNPSPLTTLFCFKEMIKGLIRVHNYKICHRDLKPGNFLIVSDEIRLSDFGTAKCMDGSMPDIRVTYATPVGDLYYAAPELLCSVGIGDKYVFHSDFFSMGAILFEMFTKNRLTVEIYSGELLGRITSAQQLLSKMRPEKRIETYIGMADELSRSIQLPDIFSYNDYVPACIKVQLNNLYKGLASISFGKRMINPNSIHRQIDICIKTLKNEVNYQRWQEEKRKRREARQRRLMRTRSEM